MLPNGLNNPFLAHKVDDTVSIPAGHIPDLHAAILQKWNEAVEGTRQTGHSIGLLMVGETGCGKSHLIAQMRRQFAADPKVVLAVVRLKHAYAGRLWRQTRAQLVSELFRSYDDQRRGTNGLLRILRNRFPDETAGSSSWLDWFLGNSTRADLRSRLEEFAAETTFDYNLLRVLPLLPQAALQSTVKAWLTGQELASSDYPRLGLPVPSASEQDQESLAAEIVFSFLRLAGDSTILVLCFDEIEALLPGEPVSDRMAYCQLATLIAGLLGEAGPRVTITSIRTNKYLDMKKVVETSHLKKLAQLETTFPPLTAEQTSRLVRVRLDAEPTCRAERAKHPKEAFWPLGQPFVQALFNKHHRDLTPRHLIQACQTEFERLRTGDPVVAPNPVTGGGRIPKSKPDDGTTGDLRAFDKVWEQRRQHFVTKPQSIHFDTVMAIGLPWLVQLTGSAFDVMPVPKHLGDVNLMFLPRTHTLKPVGICFCASPRAVLWRLLQRLIKQWNAAKIGELGSLVVLLPRGEPLTEAAQNRLTTLAEAGVTVLYVEHQQLAEFAAFQDLLTCTQQGTVIRRHGQPATLTEYRSWALAQLSPAVKHLFRQIFGIDPPGADDAAKK